MEIREDRKYTKEHEWAQKRDGKVFVGISDYAQSELGDVVFVDLPDIGMEIQKGDGVLSVESVKEVSEVYAPVTGKVSERNDSLEDAPELVNTSSYDDGWMLALEQWSESDFDALMSADEYKAYVSEVSR